MDSLYLLLSAVCSSLLSIMSTLFGRKNPDRPSASSLYTVLVTGTAFLSWSVICLFESGLEWRVIGYAVLYGLFYAMAVFGMFKAYQLGSVSLTAFVKQLSLIGVAVWGFFFWGNPITAAIAGGLLLVVIALYLCFKPQKQTDKAAFSAKWLLFALLLLVGNAGCSIVQKYQQMAFDGQHRSLFMLMGIGISFAVSLVMYLSGKRTRLRELSPVSLIFPVIGGISSALLNLLILILLASAVSESLIFPVIAVGGLILTMLFSLFAYRERLRPVQWVGFAVGAIGLVFLNL